MIKRNNFIRDERHEETAGKLRKFGVIGIILGVLISLLGLLSLPSLGPISILFFALGGFISLPSLMMCVAGSQKKILEYQVSQVAPIAAQAQNYMMEETAETTGDYVNEIFERAGGNIGKTLNKGFGSKEVVKVRCPYCKELNDEDAKYCDNCGQKL